MKFEKLTVAILSIFAIILMIVPSIAVNEINQRTETNIISVEGLYTNGNDIEIGTIDKTEIETYISGSQEYGSDINNDSALIRHNSGSVLDEIYYGDYISYVGNGTYTIVPDYTDNPEVVQTYSTNIMIPLNITPQQIIDSDFIRLNVDFDCEYYLVFTNDLTTTIYYWNGQETTNTTEIWIPTLTYKSHLQNSINSTIYLAIGGIQSTNGMPSEPTTITFGLESFQLTPADSFEVEDTTLFFLMIFGLNVMFTVAFVFATDTYDVFVDKNRKDKK